MADSIAAVVVTYNRKDILVECLNALLSQTRPVDKIILIDNASSDGTQCYLAECGYLSNPLFDYVRLPENKGGAGGFHDGIKRGYELGYDWLWLLDDDTLAHVTCLNNLLHSARVVLEPIGFICSKIEWIDGSIHLMNIPNTKQLIRGVPFNKYDSNRIILVESCSFVSVLLNRNAVTRAGYPVADMFIWGDDVEFFSRITSMGFFGIYASRSKATHKTTANYNSNILYDNVENFWKYRYGVRNELYTTRRSRGTLVYLYHVIYRLLVVNFTIVKIRQTSRARAVMVNSKATLSSMIFNPTIDEP